MNTLALEHEVAMVDVYSNMKPDAFTLQLQTVLADYYEDIKGVVRASGCTKSRPRWSTASSRTKMIPDLRQTLTLPTLPLLPPTPPTQQPPQPPRRTGAQSRTRRARGGASFGPQPWGQERGQQGAGGRGW